jgi:hypothetical protein
MRPKGRGFDPLSLLAFLTSRLTRRHQNFNTKSFEADFIRK